MDYVAVFLPLAMIILSCKLLAIVCKKIGLPQVIGFLVAGLLLSIIKYIPNQTIFTTTTNEGLGFLAKIGVVLIMFSAGMGTDLTQIKATGIKSIVITLAGVITPMLFGFLATVLFFGGFANIANNFKEALSYGCILTATSVSVTVATLKELGKLNSPMGTCVVSAAILDDIIGIIVLSIVLGIDGTSSGEQAKVVALLHSWGLDLSVSAVISIILFFIIFIGAGIFIAKLFRYLAKKYDHHRRIPMYSMALAFAYAWCAEELFGVADITGAYLAGVILSTNMDKFYIDSKTDAFSDLFFTPIFFANIGINISFGSIDSNFVIFGIVFILAGILGKFLGCGITAKLFKFSWKDSCSIGVGMMVRAEVALVCTEKLKPVIGENITTFVVLLILITSLSAPVLLKLINRDSSSPNDQPKKKTYTKLRSKEQNY